MTLAEWERACADVDLKREGARRVLGVGSDWTSDQLRMLAAEYFPYPPKLELPAPVVSRLREIPDPAYADVAWRRRDDGRFETRITRGAFVNQWRVDDYISALYPRLKGLELQPYESPV